MLTIIRKILTKIIEDIDCGNSNANEEDLILAIKVLQTYTDKTQKLSKYQSCQYLNISRASFDNYVREGKLPLGKKEAGFKEKFWLKKDLDKLNNNRKNKLAQ